MMDRRPPSLSRVARVDLDLAFRNRGEAALVHVAYHGRTVARLAFGVGALSVAGGLASGSFVPVIPVLLIFGGALALGLAGVAKVVSLLAAIPAHATRAVRVLGWSAPTTGPAAASEGSRAVVRGRITALRTVPALGGLPAVFVRLRATRRGRGAELQRAEDFLLDDGTDAPIRVHVAHALCLDRTTPMFGSWSSPPMELLSLVPSGTVPIDLEEAALYAGDEVEVVGRSELVVDPSFSDRLARATPLVRVLSGTPDEPLLVRSLVVPSPPT